MIETNMEMILEEDLKQENFHQRLIDGELSREEMEHFKQTKDILTNGKFY